MITREEARTLVDQYLASMWPDPEDGPRIVWEEQTEEYTGCWVCFWVLKRYLESKDRRYRTGGNYPIIVDKIDGSLYSTGFRPVEEYVEIFNTDKSRLNRLFPRRL
jgi:hypothetical protein